MEQNKTNKKLVVVLIIIIIGLVLGGGYTTYKLLLNNSNSVDVENNNNVSNNQTDTNDNNDTTNTDIEVKENVISRSLVDTIEGNILVERVVVKAESSNQEYYLLYTKKDTAGKTIWTYKTEKDTDAKQCNFINTYYIDGKIYIEENKNITYLNKETGTANWKWAYTDSLSCPIAPRISTDPQNNTYITNGKSLAILDKNGNIKSNKTYNLEISDASIEFIYINENEGYLFGLNNFVQINLKDYKEKNSGTYNYLMSNDEKYLTYTLNYKNAQSALILKGTNNNGVANWMYKTQTKPVGQYTNASIFKEYNDRIYLFDYDKIVVINKQSGKTLWSVKNIAANSVYGFLDFDENQNMYIYKDSEIDIYDQNGNIKTIKHNANVAYYDGVEFKIVNKNEILYSGESGIISVNLSNYTVNYEITFSSTYIKKTDAKNNIIWKYETDSNIYFILNDIVYINEENKLTALNIENGKVLWTNLEKNDNSYWYENGACYDSKGNLYLIQKNSPNLWIIDKNGQTIKKIDKLNLRADLQGNMYVTKLSLRNNETELVAKTETENVIINLKDYSIKYEK